MVQHTVTGLVLLEERFVKVSYYTAIVLEQTSKHSVHTKTFRVKAMYCDLLTFTLVFKVEAGAEMAF